MSTGCSPSVSAMTACISSRLRIPGRYLAPLGSSVGFVLYYEGVRKIGSAKAAAFILLVPGVTAAVISLGEKLRWQRALGGAIVLFGLWVVLDCVASDDQFFNSSLRRIRRGDLVDLGP